jgi:hypothetical protein
VTCRGRAALQKQKQTTDRPANTLEDFSTSALLVRSSGVGIAAAPAVKRGASLHGKLFYLFTRCSSRKKLLFSATATQIQRDARVANRLLGAHAEQTLRL